MTGFLSEFGKKLADRWLTVLVLPGVLFVAAAVCAHLLGHRHALDRVELADQLTVQAEALTRRPALLGVTVLVMLLAATAAGIATQWLSNAVHTVLTTRRPAQWVTHRRKRAQRADQEKGVVRPEVYLPCRLTPIGDRFQLAYARVRAQYGSLDLTLVWPRLWLLAGKDTRDCVQAAYAQYAATTALIAWSLLYLALGLRWWPAAAAGAMMLLIGYRRSRLAAGALADLIEATVDIHQKGLAEAVGVALPDNRIGQREAASINNILAKRPSWPIGAPPQADRKSDPSVAQAPT